MQAAANPPEPNEPLKSTRATASRRELVAQGAFMSAAVLTGSLIAGCAKANDQTPNAKTNTAPAAGDALYDRLGGIFPIAAVVNYFSDEIIKDSVAGAGSKNPALREWHTKQLGRLPGLKFMRTLWVASASGGPYQYTPTRPGKSELGLEEAHRNLKISPQEFDAVAAVLSRSLDHFAVPAREKGEVLAAFAAHKDEVTTGWRDAQKR